MNQSVKKPPFIGQMNAVVFLPAIWRSAARVFTIAAGCLCLLVLSPASAGGSQEVLLDAARDSSLFEEGDLSNGGGAHLFTGTILTGARRRALLQFDLSVIPPGATIESARLELTMSRTISGTLTVALHRLLRDWGEGSVDAPGQEGTGAAAAPGDATWTQNRLGSSFWAQPGGDFESTRSAASSVRDNGRYSWTSQEMADDVQSWLDDPGTNFGWIVIGNEAAGFGTAKRLDSRENPDPAVRPLLVVSYSGGVVPAPLPVPAMNIPGLLILISLLMVTAFIGRLRGG